ncbi:MAG: Mu transposase domain-containing protein, partial [Mycobacteriaceae bacterium]
MRGAAAGHLETNFEPGRKFANHLDFQLQRDDWFAKANARTHKTLRARPIDRLKEERAVMRPLPECPPDCDRRWVIRVAPDPHVRFDTVDYSLDPGLVGRRVEVRVSQREVLAMALDTGELACRHERCFAKHRTVTAPLVAAVFSHFASSSAIRTDFGVKVMSAIESL